MTHSHTVHSSLCLVRSALEALYWFISFQFFCDSTSKLLFFFIASVGWTSHFISVSASWFCWVVYLCPCVGHWTFRRWLFSHLPRGRTLVSFVPLWQNIWDRNVQEELIYIGSWFQRVVTQSCGLGQVIQVLGSLFKELTHTGLFKTKW